MTVYFLNNEVFPGRDAQTPSAIEVFASREDVERHFESWYVNETYLLLGSNGRRYLLAVTDGKIRVTDSGDDKNYDELIRKFLAYYLSYYSKAIAQRRKLDPKIAEVSWDGLPTETLFRVALLFCN
jgi:hypothetical protein